MRSELSAEVLSALEEATSDVITVEAGDDLCRSGEPVTHIHYLLRGTVVRYREDKRGHRQVVGIGLHGEFLDVDSFQLRVPNYSLRSLDTAEVAKIPFASLDALLGRFPDMVRTLWTSTVSEGVALQYWIFRIGRLRGEGRIAHLICELSERLRQYGRFEGGELNLPLRQCDYAEACGMTPIHANRCFASLRERGFVDVKRARTIHVLAEPELRKLAMFNAFAVSSEGNWSCNG
ncbi:Crp/Fnr family transcriptional regulator [Qipengyuania citrea]|uniref:Crp/Fnr family transcriptional regulator n=1 Tax=Qipengyuania citrea TaxID=225971 RepID=A0ABY4U3H9_9SPHN|nr:Crp/Fnr family transcriptional regulator [Qipengyuania citrea]USA60667.1 Crp/Fnr family transcriptional regulator [Qipengyuania citrea]